MNPIFIISYVFTCIAIFAISFILFVLYRKRKLKVLKRLNIVGPVPNFLTGNVHSFKTQPIHVQLQEWTKEFGKVYGYFEGSLPVIVVSDPDILLEIFVKQFHNFSGRKDFPLVPNDDDFIDANMFIAKGARWKRLRSVCNPHFSAFKLKEMKILMDECCERFIANVDVHVEAGEPFDIYLLAQSLTLDVIAETAFGMKTKAQTDPKNDPFLARCQRFFRSLEFFKISPLLIGAILFPEIRMAFQKIHMGLDVFRERGEDCLKELTQHVIRDRKRTGEFRPDMLQSMLEVETPTLTKDDMLNAEVKKLTTSEVVSNSILLLAAGYETTSTTLGYILYMLALHPDIQTKLADEIDGKILDTKEIPSYELLHELEYLDMVIHETMRLFPVGSIITTRTCLKTSKVGADLVIPTDCAVAIDVWSVHHDPELWGPEDTNLFVPERFEELRKKARHPMAFLAFGAGPKNCLGNRFALLEIKLALTMLLKRYCVKSCDETEVPIKLLENATIVPKNGVTVQLKRRTVE